MLIIPLLLVRRNIPILKNLYQQVYETTCKSFLTSSARQNSSSMACPDLTLANGKTIPIVGLGTWKSKPGEVRAAVETAIDCGYRHIDCALVYGNEPEVGAAIKEKISQGVVKREDLFITSKLWNSFHHPDAVLTGLKTTLKDLCVDYVDLYLIHWPYGFKTGLGLFPKDDAGNFLFSDDHYVDTWKELEKAVDAGLVRSIGLSNFNSQQIQDVLDASRIKPVMNQVEIHPYFSQEKLVKFCNEKGLAVTAYSPFGSPDRPWAPAGEPSLLEDPNLVAVAKKYNKSSAQVIIRWMMQRNIVVIPKSVTPSRICSNFQVFDFELSKDDMTVLDGFNRNERVVVPMITTADGKTTFRDGHHKFFPFNIEF